MRYADHGVLENTIAQDVAYGVMRSLELAHSVGITQCDLRSTNILHFPSSSSAFSSSSSSSYSSSSSSSTTSAPSAIGQTSGTWQLIDYGRCCFQDQKDIYEVDVFSTQAKKSGRRIRAMVDRCRPRGIMAIDLARWTPEDDYQMLISFLLEHHPGTLVHLPS